MFSFRLKDAISEIVPSRILIENPSGFHLAGYNKEGFPDFFYFSNIGAFEDFIYKKIQPRYSNPESHFLDRDAKEQGWDGINPYSIKFITSWYRNGDIRAHVYAWKLLDYIFDNMFKFTDFKRPTTLEEYGKYVKFKLSMIGQICKNFSDTPLIGNSFDVLCIYKLNNTIQTQWIK